MSDIFDLMDDIEIITGKEIMMKYCKIILEAAEESGKYSPWDKEYLIGKYGYMLNKIRQDDYLYVKDNEVKICPNQLNYPKKIDCFGTKSCVECRREAFNHKFDKNALLDKICEKDDGDDEDE